MDISKFQTLMKDLYFQNDIQRGILRSAIWLGEEVGELMHELKVNPNTYNKIAIGEEMADIYAWVASLANLLEIDLETAVRQKYTANCPRCNQMPCVCKKDLP